jgi:hypothetical protein
MTIQEINAELKAMSKTLDRVGWWMTAAAVVFLLGAAMSVFKFIDENSQKKPVRAEKTP